MTPCQFYTGGSFDDDGYGIVWLDGTRKAHRLAWALHNGEDPAGRVVRHRCNNPSCVNPEHLEIGTHADNMHDKVVCRAVLGENNPASKLTEQDVRGIRCLTNLGVRGREISRLMSISQTAVVRIANRKMWSHVS